MSRQSFVVLSMCVVAALIATPSEAVDFQLVLGLEGSGELDVGNLERDGGFNLGFEVVQDFPLLEVGAGLEHSFARDVDGDAELSYTLLYGVARFFVFGPAFATLRYGYTEVSLDDLPRYDDGGATWSVGGGVSVFDTVKAEALYTRIGGDLDYDAYQLRLIYTF